MIFELLTGDFLFDPRKGEAFKKNDDHLAQVKSLKKIKKNRKILHRCKNYCGIFQNISQRLD